jgi:hypothetical protein
MFVNPPFMSIFTYVCAVVDLIVVSRHFTWIIVYSLSLIYYSYLRVPCELPVCLSVGSVVSVQCTGPVVITKHDHIRLLLLLTTKSLWPFYSCGKTARNLSIFPSTTYVISHLDDLKKKKVKKKVWNYDIFKWTQNITSPPPFQWMRNETQVAEEYCWAITQEAAPLCCARSVSSVLDCEFQLDSIRVLISELRRIFWKVATV